jgi:hypothetical protein
MSRSIRLLALFALLTGVLAAAGCGASTSTSIQESASSEGLYLELGGLKYQVQMSRYLNPADAEDSAYLKGLPAGVDLGSDETWFGVFMRVENDGDKTATASSTYEITDTENHAFRPVPLDPKVNDFAYTPVALQPAAIVPGPDTIAGQGVIQGTLVLFKLKEADLQNRPLTLRISEGQSGPSTSVELDL